MGLFKTLKEIKGTLGTDTALMTSGLLGRAIVTDVRLTGMAVAVGVEAYRVVEYTAQVFLDGREAYIATGKQRVAEWRLSQLMGAACAVRVDASDPSRIALDFDAEAPIVTMPRPADGGAARLLVSGTPAEAVIIQHQPLGLRNWEGHEVHLFSLTVMGAHEAPRQAQVGLSLPPAALPLVYPGSRVPVRLGTGPIDVVIDWDAALASAPR